jgi:glycyl-tRNA synthetase beta chain
VGNIVEKQAKDVPAGKVDAKKLKEASEVRLAQACSAVRAKIGDLVKADDYPGVLKEIISLRPSVDAFFDEVMVMTDQREVRENRVRLLQEVRGLFSQVADFSKIQAES